MPTKTVHNVETGEVTERELTAEELQQHEIDLKKAKDDAAAAKAVADAKSVLLSKLRITEDEAKLLLA